MSRHVPGQPGQPPAAGPTGGSYPAQRLAALVARQPLVLVVGPGGAGRSAALTVLAGPAAGGTMIDLGALWMAVDPPGERPRTVRLNGAPSAVGRRSWEAVAGPIGAVAAPPAVVLIDTFQGLVAALGDAGAAETVAALVTFGRTVVVVLDELAEAERFQELAVEHGVLVSVDGTQINDVRPVADLPGDPPGSAPDPAPASPPVQAEVPAADEGVADRRWRWWRRTEPAVASGGAPASHPELPASPADTATPISPVVSVQASVADATGQAAGQGLVPGGYYLIRLAMTGGSPGPEPAGGPAIGAWVEVAVVAETVAVPAGPHAMFVPRRGTAWTCPCQPGGPHTCLADERSPTLDLPFVAPRRPDVYRVQISVRQRGAVLHQMRLELPVRQ